LVLARVGGGGYRVPVTDLLHFDDFAPGQKYPCGTHTITEDEIVAFACEYDPQPQHVDPELAKQSLLGGLAASGWHVGALMMRMAVDNFLSKTASQGSPGVEELRWLKPVRPGDALRFECEVLEVRPSSKPARGFLKTRWSVWRPANDAKAGGDERVMMLVCTLMMGRKTP
jgi:acyl dehydratase